MGWTYVLFAAIVEVFWVLGLKFSTNWWMWGITVLLIIFSFYFIVKACEHLPSGTVYAVFTGSGAAIISLIDFIFLDTPFTPMKAVSIGLIIIGVIGIQMSTNENTDEARKDIV